LNHASCNTHAHMTHLSSSSSKPSNITRTLYRLISQHSSWQRPLYESVLSSRLRKSREWNCWGNERGEGAAGCMRGCCGAVCTHVCLFNLHKHAVLHKLTLSTTHRVVRICSQILAIKTTGSNASTLVELLRLTMKRMMVAALLPTTNQRELYLELVSRSSRDAAGAEPTFQFQICETSLDLPDLAFSATSCALVFSSSEFWTNIQVLHHIKKQCLPDALNTLARNRPLNFQTQCRKFCGV